MADLTACFSSAKQDWATPDALFHQYNARFDFDLDAAASSHNAKVPIYLDVNDDSLTMTYWPGSRVWLNPPYGKNLKLWYAKARQQADQGKTVVMLVPSRTDTKYWHEFVWNTESQKCLPGVELHLLKGRVKFVGAEHSAPFPSAVIIMTPTPTPAPTLSQGDLA